MVRSVKIEPFSTKKKKKMTILRLTDEEMDALKDCLAANEDATYQRIEEIEAGDTWEDTRRLVRGYKSLYKKVWGEEF